MLKKIQMYRCPNPKCQKDIENLILVRDHSKTPADVYYGCPYCLFKLDPTATQVLKKEETFVEEKKEETFVEENKETKNTFPKREIPPGCPQYLGYLSIDFKDANFPQECLMCPRILDCTRKQ